MSQCYHIELKTAVNRLVKGEDSVSYPIELSEILPKDEMVALLREQLKQAGWKSTNEEETVFETEGPAGETLTISLDSMELTAALATEKEVEAEASATGRSEAGTEAARQQAQRLLKEEASVLGDQIEDAGTKELQHQIREQLAESEEARQRIMNELLQGVYAESLKRKAGQLGDIMEISESTGEDGNYELTIRVEQ
ncbi:MAG: hypothetical protein AAF514_11560 [Verrucomicrobiota bacterium]